MNENNTINQENKKALISIKQIMRALSILCVVFVFCPSFIVSCSGKDINVSAMTAVKGISSYGEQVVKPHPVMLACLALPIAILALLFIKKLSEQKTAGIIMACAIVDFVIWLIFRATVKKMAEKNYCSFKTTMWYGINLIVILLLIVFSMLAVIKKIEMEGDLIAKFAGGGGQGTYNQASATAFQVKNATGSLARSAGAGENYNAQGENVSCNQNLHII